MASNFACTPNTKLRKDTEFLGAFAKNFQFTGSIGHAPAKSVTFKSSTTSLKQSSAPKKEQAKNLGVFYKIQGVASLRDEEGRREARQQSELQRQKNKRSQKIMDKRKIDRKSPTPELVPVNANRNANINLKKLQSTHTQHSVPLANKNSNAISSTRKDQLQRWKEQKTAAEIAARRNIESKRAPVHTHLSLATKQAPGQGMPNKITKNVNVGLTKKPPVPQGSTGNCIPGSKPNERRVTRAMAKAQIPGPTVAYVQPAIAKMKTLSINTTKTRKGLVQPVPEVKVQVTTTNTVNVKTTSGTTRQFENQKLGSSPVEDIIMTTLPEKAQDTIEQLSTLQTAPHPPAIAPPTVPKKKIMALDKYYIEYNQYLAEACTTLMKNWTLWENKRENDKSIPEDILSEIESTLGQANLLMRSKLPQFVQLLYFYLSNENFPGPVLSCDLEGWWDVASMQVERVTDRFNELCKLEQNGWRSAVESRPPVNKVKINKPMKKSSEESSESSSETSGQANSKPAKSAQASLGLRQFLANKRKNALSVDPDLKTDVKNDNQVKISNSASPVKSNNLVYTTPTKCTSSASRQFEGGFFQVTSPLRATNTNSSVCRTPVQSVRENGNKSISRRASVGHNCSLVTLAVRKSMGPMFKIGATTQLTTETEQIAGSESSANTNLDSQPMEMYASFNPPKPKPTQFSKNSCSDFYATEQSKNPSLWCSYLNATNCSHNSSGNNNSTNVSPNTGNIVKTQSFTSVSQLQLLNCLTRNKNYMHQWNKANTDYKLINRQRENGNPEPANFHKSNPGKQRLEIDSANLNALRDCRCQCKHCPYFANSSLTPKESQHTPVVSMSVASPDLGLDVNATEPSQPDDCRMINLYNHGKKHNYRDVNSSTSSDTNNSVSDNRATLTKDITPRRSSRISSQVSGEGIDQPMSEAHYPSQRSGSD